MNLSSIKALLSSLALVSLAITGCAVAPSEDAADDEAVESVESELSTFASKFVGKYEWRLAESGGFLDFASLHLKKNGRYAAEVEQKLPPGKLCIHFPCTESEEGTWKLFSTKGGLRLRIYPKGKQMRAYVVSKPAADVLFLRRNGKKTTLFKPKKTSDVCANSLILCAPGSVCQDIGGQPECVPQITCANVLCEANSVCQMENGFPKCVPQITCANVLCAPGTVCEMHNNAPVCVPSSQLPCIKTGCSSHICSDQPVVTTCIFRPEYACYADATCERQADGQCGFTQTETLTSCLASHSDTN
ncbi:MAG TPA: hypothetical protein VM580_21360 [Labilithrix sp.]|nr:hypothetical protein [Labilithrix sp.]